MLNAILSIFKSKAAKLNDAAKDGDIAKIERLLNKGADPDGKKPKGETEGGFTPLHFAAVLGHADAIITLLNAGAKLKAKEQLSGKTSLDYAAYYGHTHAITTLLNAGANPNARTESGRTPLHFAARQGHTEAITTLLDAGADPNARDGNSKTAFDLIDENSPIYGTDAYWRLNDAKYNQ